MSRLHSQTTSFSRHYLWILLFVLAITQCKPALSDSEPIGHTHVALGNTGVKSSVSQFNSNLKQLLKVLARNTPMSGYNASVYGESPNIVLGFIQCRGDATEAECSDCCQSIIKGYIATRNDVIWFTWYEMCELVYWNQSSPAIPHLGYDFIASCNGYLLIHDPTGVQNLLYNLSDEASTSSKRFAKGSSVDSSGQNIYGLVQCFIDLSTSNCTYCLSQAILQLDILQLGLGTHIYMGACYFIISSEPTYSNSTCTGLTEVNNSRKLPSNLGFVGSVLAIMALLLL